MYCRQWTARSWAPGATLRRMLGWWLSPPSSSIYFKAALVFSGLVPLTLSSAVAAAPPGVQFIECPKWGPGWTVPWVSSAKTAVLIGLKGLQNLPGCVATVKNCVAFQAENDPSKDYPNPYHYFCAGTICNPTDQTGGDAVGYEAAVEVVYGPVIAEGTTPPFDSYAHCAISYDKFRPGKNEGNPSCQNQNEGCASPGVGNPINLGTGNKFQPEVDYRTTGDGALEYVRYYNSEHSGPSAAGLNWTHTWSRSIQRVATTEADAVRPDGRVYRFNQVGATWAGDPDNPETLVGSTATGWTLTTRSNDVEQYSADGTLLSITTASGRVFTLSYANGTDTYFYQDPNYPNSFVDATSPSTPLLAGTLVKVTDFRGRSLNFFYSLATQTFPWKIEDPAGNVYLYQYDSLGRLTSVTYPTTPATSRSYVYNEPANTANTDLPLALTGLIDENAQRFASFGYDSSGKATSTSHSGNVESYAVSLFGSSSTTYTDPLGSSWTDQISAIQEVAEVTQRQCTSCAGTPSESFNFDSSRNLTSKTDFNGNLTCYTYDSTGRDLEISRTEGLAGTCAAPQTTSATRTITKEWNSTWRMPERIAEPLKITTFSYNGEAGISCAPSGAPTTLLCSKTVQGTTDADGSQGLGAATDGAPARVWSYTYNAFGQVLTIDGPRTDLSDVSTLAYYASDDPAGKYKAGDLESVTDAKGHVTQYAIYDAAGRLAKMLDANGLETLLQYTPRGWLQSRMVGNAAFGYETTSYSYDNIGQLTQVTLPDGSFVTYAYDAAHRLADIRDGLGNHIHYALDSMGNRVEEDAYDIEGTLARTHSRVIDDMNRVKRDVGGTAPALQVTQYGYDANGNATTIIDPLNRVTAQVFDARDRLTQVIDPLNGPTAPTVYTYNGGDQLTGVKDPMGLTTTYQVNGFGEVGSLASPDTGNTAYAYDPASNLKSKVDARGLLASYSYDELNRITGIAYSDETVAYTYDSCAHGIGRLCSIADGSGSTQFSYDLWGRVSTKTETVGTKAFVMRYSYNAAGQLATVVMPSGHAVTYGYQNSRPVTASVDGQTILSGAFYEPFGPNGGWVWGNSTQAAPNTHTRVHDLDFRLKRVTSDLPAAGAQPYFDRQIGWDEQSRVSSITDLSNSALGATYGYDQLDHLSSATQGANAWSYAYNGVGDRITSTANGQQTTYSLVPGSHRLQSVSGTQNRNFGFDAAGNVISDGTRIWTFGGNGRNKQVTSGTTTTTYALNALGQRVNKVDSTGATTYFVYDERGHLVGEYDANGNMIEETIWLEDLPVSVIR